MLDCTQAQICDHKKHFQEIHKTSSVAVKAIRLERGLLCQSSDQLSKVKCHAHVENLKTCRVTMQVWEIMSEAAIC